MKALSRHTAVVVVALGALSAIPASASAARATTSRATTVKCVGTADFCGATVSIAGGASNKRMAVTLSDTDLKLVAVRVIPGASRGAYEISRASYELGGSVYRFTLNAVQGNPKRARIVLLFAAGTPASVPRA
jgi:hypothetical protein